MNTREVFVPQDFPSGQQYASDLLDFYSCWSLEVLFVTGLLLFT